jgi:hypothetical protein
LVFFDTPSIHFEGQGGQSIGQRGFNNDHRPDLEQMVVGVLTLGLTESVQGFRPSGRPACIAQGSSL